MRLKITKSPTDRCFTALIPTILRIIPAIIMGWMNAISGEIIFIWKRSQGFTKAGIVTGKDRRQGHDEERVLFKKRRTFFYG